MKMIYQKSFFSTRILWLTPFLFIFSSIFLYAENVCAGSPLGVGYYSGPNSGPTINFALSTNNSIKLVAPLSFDQVIFDYQFQVKRYTKGRFRFSIYLGIGTDVTFSQDGKNNSSIFPWGNNNKNTKGDILAALRVPVGVAASMSSYPFDLFIELAPRLEIYNGSDIEVDGSKLDWKRIGIGARYYF